MAEKQYQETVTRQPEWLEEYQRQLLSDTQYRTREQPYKVFEGPEVAGFSADQLKSFDLARQGVGSYVPWLAESGTYARGAPAAFAAAVPETQNLYRAATGAFGPMTTSYGGQYGPLTMAPGSRYAPIAREAQGIYSALPEQAGFKYSPLARAVGTAYGPQSAQPGVKYAAQSAQPGTRFDPLTQAAGSQFGATSYDPSAGTAAYMSPYLSAVKDVTMGELDREAAKERAGLSARAAAAGAFGGARHGIEGAELSRGILEKKAQALAGLNQQGYAQALQAGMGEHGRQQAALAQAHEAQRQAGLGERGRVSQQQQGAWEAQRQAELAERARVGQTGYQAHEAQRQAELAERARVGQTGFQAYEAQQAREIGETGRVSQQQQAAWEAQRQAELAERARVGQTGFQAYEAQRQAQLGELGRYSGQQQGAWEAQRQAELAERARYGQAGQTAFEAANARRLQEFARAQAAAQQAYEAQQGRRLQAGQGLAELGSTGAGLLQQSSAQMAGLGGLTQQYGAADVSMLSQSGALQQQQLQKDLDIQRQKFIEAEMQPYQRLSFMSDILRGVPSTQSSLTAQTAAGPSKWAQGIGGLSAVAGLGGSEGFNWWGGDSQ